MGERALKSPMKGKKHIANSKPVTCFFKPTSVHVVQAVVTGIDGGSSSNSVQPLNVSTSPKQLTLTLKSTDSVEKRKVEIVWILKCVVCDWSASSAEHISDLFKTMFLDSQITSEFQMSHTKLAYSINFGIAPYFRQIFVDEINSCSFFTMSLDESLNKVMQTSQMDLIIRFWHTINNQVYVRYWDFKFLGYTKADDILAKFNDFVSTLALNKKIQISMNGPNTNWKFIKFLKRYRLENEQHQLIDIRLLWSAYNPQSI